MTKITQKPEEIIPAQPEPLPDDFTCECPIPVKPMQEWIVEDVQGRECRPCALGPTVQWYTSELEERGKKEMAQELLSVAEKEDINPLTLCEQLDKIKEQVGGPLRERLLEFDCATQLYESASDTPEDSTALK